MTSPAHRPEDIKRNSQRLRGTLTQSLQDPITGAIAADDTLLIKFHGSYQQDDRDQRDERRRRRLEPDYSFMIRTRTPGGVVDSQQWLDLDRIATTYANGSLRLTTRQAFQFHGVVKQDLPDTMQAINATLIDTLAACGDVNRNVLVAAHPAFPAVREQVYAQARDLSTHLLPNSRAYYELWLGEQRVAGGAPEDEPLYGETYLPRKFKIAFAVPPVNDVDVYAHDLGFIAVIGDDGALRGYDVSIGGGMGATHDDPETYPRLADVIGFITPDRLTSVAEAVLTTQRDVGNRELRKRARLKYTIDDRGLDWFRSECERRAGFTFAAPAGVRFDHHGDRFGWMRDAGGGEHLGLQLVAGRIADDAAGARLGALRAIATLHPGGFRLTPNQNVIVTDVRNEHRARIEALAREAGLLPAADASALQRDALACVALPTCGLAMAEAERYLATFVSRVDSLLDRHGLRAQPIVLRISGCANGCSRPYLAEIALVGKGPGRYNLFLGGDGRGQRLAVLHRANLDEPALLAELDDLLGRYATGRDSDERFGDFLWRNALLQPRLSRSLPRIDTVLA